MGMVFSLLLLVVKKYKKNQNLENIDIENRPPSMRADNWKDDLANISFSQNPMHMSNNHAYENDINNPAHDSYDDDIKHDNLIKLRKKNYELRQSLVKFESKKLPKKIENGVLNEINLLESQ